MRKKIAGRKRRTILKKGGRIVREEWLRAHTGRRKDDGFAVEVNYLGWNIFSADEDELGAYNGVLECCPGCEEEPRDGSGGGEDRINGEDIS